MAARKTPVKIHLPHILIEAVKDGRAVLLFGAGASMECKNSQGDSPPSGDQLRDYLAQKYLGTRNETRDLATVAEMSIANGEGEPLVFEEIANRLTGYPPSNAHMAVANFRWRGLATTNYDTLIEGGYTENKSRRQTCVPFVKDSEPYDDRLRYALNPVPLLKLHGCLNHRLDKEIPLVLSHNHFHRLSRNRTHLLQRLQQWAQTSVIIFVGYRLADAHIRALIYDIDPGRRPQWYIVAPGADEHDIRFWASKNVEVITAKFGQFIESLDAAVPDLFRALALPSDMATAPYRRHFRGHDVASDRLRSSLNSDVQYVYAGLPFEEVEAQKFYAGYDPGWCGIFRKYDFPRKVGERLLFTALDDDDKRSLKFFLLQGAAGSGKTIALRRAAYDAAVHLDQMVFWLNETGKIRPEIFEELYGLTGLRPILFVDHISLHAEAINAFLKRLKKLNIPITIIASERAADWGSYCNELEQDFQPSLFSLRRLNEREAEDLVELLERHKCLGLLEEKSKEERIASFLHEDRSDRQLLVVLHELTQGKPFEKIILEEYERIIPDSARRLYLDIATLHQFGVSARAGAISRISGIRFSDFEADFFSPLKDIVRVTNDRYTGDRAYETRHMRVASIVFGVACRDDDAKSDQLSRILGGLDPGFSSDKRVLEEVCKGRVLANQFTNVEAGRTIFEGALIAAPNSAFLHQQASIYEYSHGLGSLDRAQELAETARALDRNNHIYIHTLAEIARRKANEAHSRVRGEQLRALSRQYLNEIWLKDARKDLTFCNLLVDEALDLAGRVSEHSKDYEVVDFDTKVGEALDRLRRAQQDFPNDSEFAAVEGRLWQKLGETAPAATAFRKAIQARPKHSGVFLRLSQIYKKSNDNEKAMEILREALERFPTEKSIHLEMALLLIICRTEPSSEIEYHFKSSFSAGDHYFDSRFFYAEYLFWRGSMEDCRDMFLEIRRIAPADYRKAASTCDDPITRKLGNYLGTIERMADRFFYIRSGAYPERIFSHVSSLLDSSLEDMEVGMSVNFKVRFNARGPVAVNVRPLRG